MGREYVSFNSGWINNNFNDFDENFNQIIKFYLFNTICEGTSSMSISIRDYGWEKEVWRKGTLRKALMDKADLKDKASMKVKGKSKETVNFISCKSDEMSTSLTNAKIKDRFQNYKENAIVFEKNRTQFMDILFYIRCAFAHGRFKIYNVNKNKKNDDNNDNYKIYIMEAIKKERRTGKYYLKARIILKEEVLLNWINIIKSGPQEDKTKNE